MQLPIKILLLGSGELGKEFTISAKRLGCYVVACDSYHYAPAQQVADDYEVFDMLDSDALRQVVAKHSPEIIVPEIEAIRTEVLIEFEESGIQITPSARAVNYTMNRDWIRDLASKEIGVRTAQYGYAESKNEALKIAERIGYPVVMKPVMSSSGKGQSVLAGQPDVPKAWEYACSGMRGDRQRVIIEEFIQFEYEITLLTIRQKEGKTLFCPPIGHRQERGDYQESWQPALMDPEILREAETIAEQVTSNLGGAGIYGVEMFVTKEEVIFSELSPRPHDTGMVTMISQNFNEFDLHARAILGLPIPEIEIYGPSASAVVLAKENSDKVSYMGVDDAMKVGRVDVRIFGKHSSRPYRRMAVCLARGDTLDLARADAIRASKKITVVSDGS